MEKELKGKWWSPFILTLSFMVVETIGILLIVIPISVIWVKYSLDSKELIATGADDLLEILPPSVEVLSNLASFSILLGVIFFYYKKIKKKPLMDLGFQKDNILRQYAKGLGIGTLEITLVVLMCFLLGSLSIETAKHTQLGLLLA